MFYKHYSFTSLCVYLYLLMMIISICSGIFFESFNTSLRLETVFVPLFIIFVILLVFIYRVKIKINYLTCILLFSFLLFLMCNFIITVYRSNVLSESLRGLVTISSNIFVFIIIITLFKFDDKNIYKITYVSLGLLGVLEAIYGITSYFLFSMFKLDIGGLMYGQQGLSYSVKGTFEEANIYGAFISISILLYASYFISGKYKKYNLVIMITLFILFIALILSWTRSAWIGTILGFIFLLTVYRKRIINIRNILFFISLVFFVLEAIHYIEDIFDRLSNNKGLFLSKITNIINPESETAISRIKEYKIAFVEWSNHPFFGNGYFSFKKFGEHFWISNLTMILLNDSGLIGLILFTMPIILLLFKSIKIVLFTNKKTIENYNINLSGVSAGFISLLFVFNFTPFHTLLFFWLYLGLLYIYVNNYCKKSHIKSRGVGEYFTNENIS
jgi:hypothetical protein